MAWRGNVPRDVEAITSWLRQVEPYTGELAGFENVHFVAQTHDARAVSQKLYVGTWQTCRVYAYLNYTPNRGKQLRFWLENEGVRVKNLRTTLVIENDILVEPFSLIARRNILDPPFEGYNFRAENMLRRYIDACFILKGLTDAGPMYIGKSFQRSFIAGVMKVQSVLNTEPGHSNRNSDYHAGESFSLSLGNSSSDIPGAQSSDPVDGSSSVSEEEDFDMNGEFLVRFHDQNRQIKNQKKRLETHKKKHKAALDKFQALVDALQDCENKAETIRRELSVQHSETLSEREQQKTCEQQLEEMKEQLGRIAEQMSFRELVEYGRRHG